MRAALRYLRAELEWLADARVKLCREVGRQETPLRPAYDQLQQLEREIGEVEDAITLIETVRDMDDDGMRQGLPLFEAAE